MKQSRPELRFLNEREVEKAVRLAGVHGDLLTVTVGTGLRFGEIYALWVGDVDLDRRTIATESSGRYGRPAECSDTVSSLTGG